MSLVSVNGPVAADRTLSDRARAVGDGYRAFYGRRAGWSLALITAAALTYGGGMVMYWLHAIHRKEHGPAVSHPVHWLLDSTLAFVGLLPLVLLLVPAAVLAADGRPAGGRAGRGVVFALVVGAAFAVLTGPGPLLHNEIAGAGTPLADAVTALAGTDPAVAASHAHPVHHSPVESGLLQVLVGLPVYVGWAWAAAGIAGRRAGHPSRRRPGRAGAPFAFGRRRNAVAT